MRSRCLPKSTRVKSVLAATLGCVVLCGFGAQNAAAATDSDAEARFVQLTTGITDYCTPVPPGGGGVVDDVSEPSSESEGIDSTQPVPVEEVPLTAVEQCAGEVHAERINDAFWQAGANGSYEALHAKLTELDYPASRIHRMTDSGGSPRARIDLRQWDGDHLALQVTGTYLGVMVEAFGAPEGVSVTEVRLKPQLDEPMF
ncbi:hypothetical protein [Streptomyces sp. NPDC014995]|uniref:hypothetical protein n=1 Tax=Streptomyces sp. NPDC014995 TaxID=3364936 RepID=UPI0036F8DADA